MKVTTRLSKLNVAELSLVRRGANNKTYIIWKEKMNESILKALLETSLDDESGIDATLKEAGIDKEAAEIIKGTLRLWKGFEEILPENAVQVLAKCAGYPEPEKKEETKEEKPDEKMQDEYGCPAITKEGKLDLSQVPEPMRPVLEQLWKEREENQARAEEAIRKAQELEDRENVRAYVAKAAELGYVPVAPEQFGLILKGIGEINPKLEAEIYSVLKAMDAMIAKSKLFEDMGRPGNGAGATSSAWAEIEALARSRVSKSSSGQTFAEAVDEVLKERPELYDRYEKEQREIAARSGGR